MGFFLHMLLAGALVFAGYEWKVEHDGRIIAEANVKAMNQAVGHDTKNYTELQSSCTQRVAKAVKSGQALARITNASPPSSPPAPDGLVDARDLRALIGQDDPDAVPWKPAR